MKQQFHFLNLEDIFLKRSLNLAVFLIGILAAQANAAFVNAYDAAKWTRSVNGGGINISGAPSSITLTSSNNGKGNGSNRNQDFTITAVASGLVTFDWNYKTNDKDGAQFDPFGWLLNGVFTQLTKDAGKKKQSGTFSAAVKIGDSFGFRANSWDSLYGSATTTITKFSAPAQIPVPAAIPSQVPVPAAIWLMGIPMMGLLGGKKLKSIMI
jgi:hypothetical protein